MRKHATFAPHRTVRGSALLVALLWGLAASPVFGVSKEILQILQQLDTLQQTLQNLQRAVDVQRGELRALLEQSNRNVDIMKTRVEETEKSTQQNMASMNARLDTITSQVQALSESLEETKARMAKLSDQMAQTQNLIQTLNAASQPPANKTPGSPGGDAHPPANVPDPDTLYNTGLMNYTSGQYQLAVQAFQEYLQYYGDTDRASNAQYYIGECYYGQGNYAQAVKEYDKCLERYPNGNKQAAAQLKKGMALVELGQKEAAVRELRAVLQRYPNQHEADLAWQRLRKLGVNVPRRH